MDVDPPKNPKLVVRRWGSAPLDLSPQPQPFLVDVADTSDLTGGRVDVTERDDDNDEQVDKEELPNDDDDDDAEKQQLTSATTVTTSPSRSDNNNSMEQLDSTAVKEETSTTAMADRRRGCGRGIVEDVRSTVLTWWCSEMTNFNEKTVAVTFFLFFACIAPAITFGAIYGKATENRIGAVEMMIATAWVGIVYSLIGGQPMMINGGTGPVLAFTEIIYRMSQSLDVPFLTFNAWVGIWVAFYMVLAAFGSLNRIIRYATRFTDEIFALLIATIFIINALGAPFSPTGLYYYFEGDHKSHQQHQDNDDYSHTAVAFLSLLVSIGTVQIAFMLRRTKFSPFLPNQMLRDTVTDFAVVAAVVIWTLVAHFAFDYVPLERLNVPGSISPTFACCTDECDSSWPLECPELEEPARRRDWLVDLGDLNGQNWIPFMAAGPAALAFILIFLDDGITWHLINHPAYKLTHGTAYDYDTVIIGLMTAINSMFGLPCLVAATVRSQNHVHALSEKDVHGKILSVQITRLTSLFIHVLCMVALFFLPVLRLIPMPVLYGVFLFMGLVSLNANTLWGRFLMFFMQPKKYPLEPWTMYVRPRRMHLFTLIQLLLFGLLYAIKSIKTVAIAFPIVIALCIPIRLYLLPRIFTEKEIVMLDGDDSEIKAFLRQNDTDAGKDGKDVSDDKSPDVTGHAGVSKEEIAEGVKENVMDDETAAAKEEEAEVPFPSDVETGDITTADLALPLPDISKRRPQRRRRKKSLSCPTPHLFFSEEAATPTIALATPFDHREEAFSQHHLGASSFHTEPSTSSSSDELIHEVSIPAGESQPRRRPHRRRKKTMSCPTHLLSHEADRHMAENYFFG